MHGISDDRDWSGVYYRTVSELGPAGDYTGWKALAVFSYMFVLPSVLIGGCIGIKLWRLQSVCRSEDQAERGASWEKIFLRLALTYQTVLNASFSRART